MTSRGQMFFAMRRTSAWPARNDSRSLAADTAGLLALCGRRTPTPRVGEPLVFGGYPPAAGPGAGAALALDGVAAAVVELPRLPLPDRLEDRDDVDVAAVRADARQDAAAVDEDAR